MPEQATKYVALLRGINVGGANLIPMPALRESFEALGLQEVTTYIQSGNVVFRTKRTPDARRLAARLEKALGAQFGYAATIVLRSRAQMSATVTRAPNGFGKSPTLYRYDVVFLKESLVAAEVLPAIKTRDGVDAVQAGDGVIYFSRLIARASQSRLPKLISMPEYKQMTIRNWNTTTKLLALMDD
jgi:uncharacterized protein (DUF1697 family)